MVLKNYSFFFRREIKVNVKNVGENILLE